MNALGTSCCTEPALISVSTWLSSLSVGPARESGKRRDTLAEDVHGSGHRCGPIRNPSLSHSATLQSCRSFVLA